MTNVQFLHSRTVKYLYDNVPDNLAHYRTGNFYDVIEDQSSLIRASVTLDSDLLTKFASIEPTEATDVECSYLIWQLLPPDSLSRSLARDERLWVRLTHGEFINYTRKRWQIPADDEKAVEFVRQHFFANTARGIERENAISRLWWMSAICSNVQHGTLENVLNVFLYRSDVRAGIIERPTTSQNPVLLNSIYMHLLKSYEGDKQLFTRTIFRDFMKRLNIEGGTKLIDAMNESAVQTLTESCIASKKRESDV